MASSYELFTTVVTFLSKYFSIAKEKRNNENIEISIDGIKVNKEKYVIYLLFEDRPSLSISFLIEFLISLKIKMNNKKRRRIFKINNYCKFFSFNSIKLLSMKVKNVKKPVDSVILDRIIMNIFFFKNSYMI